MNGLSILLAGALCPVHAVPPMTHGLAAQGILNSGLGTTSATSESLYETGFKGAQAMRGLDTSGKPVVSAEDSQTDKDLPKELLEQARRKRGLKTNEPPAPALGSSGEAPKGDWKKRVLKFAKTWGPIAIFYYSSVKAIIDPMGAAAGGIRMLAIVAAIGTAMILYKIIKERRQAKTTDQKI